MEGTGKEEEEEERDEGREGRRRKKKRRGRKSHSDGYGFLFLHFQKVYKISSTLPLLHHKHFSNDIVCANIYHST